MDERDVARLIARLDRIEHTLGIRWTEGELDSAADAAIAIRWADWRCGAAFPPPLDVAF